MDQCRWVTLPWGPEKPWEKPGKMIFKCYGCLEKMNHIYGNYRVFKITMWFSGFAMIVKTTCMLV
jgi:hypothetical protein